jgi:hypothetical protein
MSFSSAFTGMETLTLGMAILQSIQAVGGQTELIDALIARLQILGHAFHGNQLQLNN